MSDRVNKCVSSMTWIFLIIKISFFHANAMSVSTPHFNPDSGDAIENCCCHLPFFSWVSQWKNAFFSFPVESTVPGSTVDKAYNERATSPTTVLMSMMRNAVSLFRSPALTNEIVCSSLPFAGVQSVNTTRVGQFFFCN